MEDESLDKNLLKKNGPVYKIESGEDGNNFLQMYDEQKQGQEWEEKPSKSSKDGKACIVYAKVN